MARRDLRAQRELQRIKENRKFILQAAEKIFSKKGYSQSSMDDIAREAQFSKATLYRYYPSKSEMFAAVIMESFQEALRGFQLIQRKPLKAEDKVRELIHYTLSYYKKKENFARVFLMERNAMKRALNLDIHDHVMPGGSREILPQEFKQIFTSFYCTMRAIIQEGIDGGEFRHLDPAEACYILGALLRGFHFRGFLLEKTYTVEESTDVLHHYFMHGIKADDRPHKGERT